VPATRCIEAPFGIGNPSPGRPPEGCAYTTGPITQFLFILRLSFPEFIVCKRDSSFLADKLTRNPVSADFLSKIGTSHLAYLVRG